MKKCIFKLKNYNNLFLNHEKGFIGQSLFLNYVTLKNTFLDYFTQ